MAEDSKPGSAQPERKVDRRAFFARLGLSSLGLAAAGTLSFSYQYMSPNVLYEPSPIVNAGSPEKYAMNSVTEDQVTGIYLIHLQEGFFSLSAICTHLGCMTAWRQDLGIIACPCHGSRFTRYGKKIAGPAPKPLPWYRTWLSDGGDIMVDRATVIPPMQFLRI